MMAKILAGIPNKAMGIKKMAVNEKTSEIDCRSAQDKLNSSLL